MAVSDIDLPLAARNNNGCYMYLQDFDGHFLKLFLLIVGHATPERWEELASKYTKISQKTVEKRSKMV